MYGRNGSRSRLSDIVPGDDDTVLIQDACKVAVACDVLRKVVYPRH